MHTCGQCEYYRKRRDECQHQDRLALDEGCDKFKYTSPEKRIDYLEAENKLQAEKIKVLELAADLTKYTKEQLHENKRLKEEIKQLKQEAVGLTALIESAAEGKIKLSKP